MDLRNTILYSENKPIDVYWPILSRFLNEAGVIWASREEITDVWGRRKGTKTLRINSQNNLSVSFDLPLDDFKRQLKSYLKYSDYKVEDYTFVNVEDELGIDADPFNMFESIKRIIREELDWMGDIPSIPDKWTYESVDMVLDGGEVIKYYDDGFFYVFKESWDESGEYYGDDEQYSLCYRDSGANDWVLSGCMNHNKRWVVNEDLNRAAIKISTISIEQATKELGWNPTINPHYN